MSKYSEEQASSFWSKRLNSTDPLSAVLTYNAPKVLNEAYDSWERKSLVSALPHKLSGKKALDIGCGTGRIALTLAKLGADVTAIDISEAMLNQLNKIAKKEKLQNRINAIQSSSDKLPFSDAEFDIVTCFGLLEHLPVDVRKRTLAEAFRVFKSFGKLFIVINNSDCVFLKGSYEMKSQRRDGYFVTLVGLEWLGKISKANKMKVKIIAANPVYALNQYFLSPDRKKYFGNERNFARFCQNSTKYDLSLALENSGLKKLASHFIVKITRGN